MITMSVSQRIYQACQLDCLAGHFGLTRVPSNRKGKWFIGTEAAWRNLADDVDFRGGNGFDPHSKLNASEGLHGRINKAIKKLDTGNNAG